MNLVMKRSSTSIIIWFSWWVLRFGRNLVDGFSSKRLDGFGNQRIFHFSKKYSRSCLFAVDPKPSDTLRSNDAENKGVSLKNAQKNQDTATDVGPKNNNGEELPSWVNAIRQWPQRPSVTEDKRIEKKKEKEVKIEPSSPSQGGWLMDPIIRNIVNMQSLLGSGDRNETQQTAIAATTVASRNFLDLIANDGSSDDDAIENSQTFSQMEAVLDSLEDAALIMNVSAAVPSDLLDGINGWNRWDQWVAGMQQALSRGGGEAKNLTVAAEGILRQATMRIESLLSEASVPASGTLQAVLDIIPANATALATQVAAERSLDLNEAVERAQQLGNFAGQLKGVADGLLRQGYVSEANKPVNQTTEVAKDVVEGAVVEPTKPKKDASTTKNGALFQDFGSASEINRYTPILGQAAEMAAMSGVIYEQTVPRSLQLGHSIVARGCSMNVKWMVTDSLASHSEIELLKDRIDNDPSETPLLIRTITIRGFDASDEEVDRETLVRRVCTANPEPLGKVNVHVHAGLWEIAQAVYKDIVTYIDWTTPQHKLILNGHSIGGSIANLILFKLTMERGADYVQDRFLRVFTFGSPPVAVRSKPPRGKSSLSTSNLRCSILEAFGLPSNFVWAFVQPWDPISRLFTEIDPLYPLIGDMGPGSDGITPWPKGPPRTLRPVTKAILEAWEGWPRFRDTYYETGSQNYVAVGIQHILLPEATRYLTERFLTVSIAVPPVRSVLRISPNEIYPALTAAFPLDVFEISYVPQAIRSFVHHFYPAYGYPLVEYVRLLEEKAEPLLVRDNLANVPEWEEEELEYKTEAAKNGWGLAGQWLQQSRETNATATAR